MLASRPTGKLGESSTSSSRPSTRLSALRNTAVRIRQAVRDLHLQENNVSLLQRLSSKTDLRNTDRSRLTSLSWAAAEGSLEVFEWLLLDYGHDDEELSRDSDNNTILHLLASIPSSQPSSLPYTSAFPARHHVAPLEQSRTSVQMAGLYHTLFPFVLDWSNSGGKTALHIAAQSGHTAFLALLLSLGADPDLTDLQGNSPLHYSAAWGHTDGARVLLEGGAAWGTRNFEGFSAGEYAFSEEVRLRLDALWGSSKGQRQRRRRAEETSAESENHWRPAISDQGRWPSDSHATAESARHGMESPSGTADRGYGSPSISDGGYSTPRPDSTDLNSHSLGLPREALGAIPQGQARSPRSFPNTSSTGSRNGSPAMPPTDISRPDSQSRDRDRIPAIYAPPQSDGAAVNTNFTSVRPPHAARSPSLPASRTPDRLIPNAPVPNGTEPRTAAMPTTAGPPVNPHAPMGEQRAVMLAAPITTDPAEQGMRRSQSVHTGSGLWGRLARG